MTQDNQSVLHELNKSLGAKFTSFGGWQMPLQFSEGTIAEIQSCRNAHCWFDVSHLGTVQLRGRGAFDQIQAAFTNDLNKIKPGRAQYSHLLDPHTAGVVDDVIVWWVSDEHFEVIPNAANTSRVIEAIGGEEITHTRALIAIQGPESRLILEQLVGVQVDLSKNDISKFCFNNVEVFVARTGYTGEIGYEISIGSEFAQELAARLVELQCPPAGLGARDILRLEAGLPLHGHELGVNINSLEAGLGWVVGWNKPSFIGHEALRKIRSVGPARTLVGVQTVARVPLRSGDWVQLQDDCDTVVSKSAGNGISGFNPMSLGDEVNKIDPMNLGDVAATFELTSAGFSPTLGLGIGMGFLPVTKETLTSGTILRPGKNVQSKVIQSKDIENTTIQNKNIQNKTIEVQVVKPPFVKLSR